MLTLLATISEDRVQLKAGGLFPVRMELVPSVLSTIITYLVILMQSSIGGKSEETRQNMTDFPGFKSFNFHSKVFY